MRLSSVMDGNRSVYLLAALTCLCLSPFLGKAFHIDDPLFLWVARQIQQHPFDPYGFVVNWYGSVAPMSEVMRNPPLTPYYIALVAAVVGWSEPVLHAAFIIPALAVVLGTYYLACQLCRFPALAALAALATPALLVSGTTVMCDVMMLAFWIWALGVWVRGIDTDERWLLRLSTGLATACLLTKYSGATILPLLCAYAIARRRRVSTWGAGVLLPVLVLAVYFGISSRLYGAHALWQSLSAATQSQVEIDWRALSRQLLVTLAFAGGSLLVSLFYMPVLWSRWMSAISVAIVTAAAMAAWFWPSAGLSLHAFDIKGPVRVIQLLLLVGNGVNVLALSLRDFFRRRDAGALLLALWVIGTFLFAAVVSWSVSARYLLPAVPAVGILLVRAMEDRVRERSAGFWPRTLAPLIPALAIALLVSWADFSLANTTRTAAASMHARFQGRGGTLWYQGHWGFQYYMDALGAEAVDVRAPHLAPGEIMIFPQNNTNIYAIEAQWVRSSEMMEFAAPTWLTTMNSSVGAGFYSSVFGPFPFVFHDIPPERYTLLTIAPPQESP